MRVKSITFQFQKSWQKHKDLRSKFLGVSRAEIRTILNIDKSNHRRNAKFLNKAKLTPIRYRFDGYEQKRIREDKLTFV